MIAYPEQQAWHQQLQHRMLCSGRAFKVLLTASCQLLLHTCRPAVRLYQMVQQVLQQVQQPKLAQQRCWDGFCLLETRA